MTQILILAASVAVYALVCLASPYHTCPHCHGTRIVRNRGGRRSRCQSCKGKGVKARPGARLAHSFYQHVKGEPGRAGRMGRIDRKQVEVEHDREAGRKQAEHDAEFGRRQAQAEAEREAKARESAGYPD